MSGPTVTIEPDAPPLEKPFQFTILSLILVTTAVAVFMALVVQGAPPIISVNYVFIVLIGTAIWNKNRGLAYSLLVLGLFFLSGVGITMQDNRPPNYSGICKRNLWFITLALLKYEAKHGHFPPAYIADENGKPIHSWRVLILPFMDGDALYKQYNFDEPWDGPNNSKLHYTWEGNDLWECPKGIVRGMTGYVVVVGPDTAWLGDKSRRLGDIKDDLNKTILVVEVANSGIHWMEPRDLHVTQMNPSLNPEMGQGISSLHFSGACVSFADGSTEFLFEEDLNPEILKALLTIDGGEDVSEVLGK